MYLDSGANESRTHMERCLLVNADDFGLSRGVNEGIVHAGRFGIVTSASLMVRGPAARHAIEIARDLDLGLHLDLGEWAYRDGKWKSRYERVPLDNPQAVEEEAHAQLHLFRQLTGRDPTHLDSHQHLHHQEPLRAVAKKMATNCNVPLREFNDVGWCGSFYGQTGKGAPYPEGISIAYLISLLTMLAPGATELGCHPGQDPELASCYRLERLAEVRTLCDPAVRRTIEEQGIRLVTFEELNGGVAAPTVKRESAAGIGS